MKTNMADLNMQDVDLYELLGIASTSTVSEVKKAYRKKALTCHPDKNPDNPRAAELFHQLSKALEILIDEQARAAYDKVLNGKKAAKLRHRELDEKRKKLKEDLEARERSATDVNGTSTKKQDTKTDEEKLQAEIERLRKEGSRQVEEEVELVRQQLLQDSKIPETPEEPQSNGLNRLRIRWKANKDDPNNGGYPYDTLLKIMSKYGDIVALVVSPKKNGSALVEFKTKDATDTAFTLEKGFLSNPLTMERLGEGSKTNPQEPEAVQTPKYVDLTKTDDTRNAAPASNLFPNYTQSSTHVPVTMSNFASAPDFSQLLYANYLGQHLRYQHSVSPGPAHAYQPGPQQVLLPGALSGAGAMMLPGVSPMTPMTSVMGYGQGYAQGYGQGYGHVSQYPVQVPVQSMHGYGSPMLGLQGYASYPGWAQALAQAQGVAGGVPQGVGTHGVAAAASRGSSYAAAGLPVLRGQMPGLPGAFPAMATAAPVFFHQLMSGLPSVIPR
ncbi:dnaJ homolog subfamily C member 17 isoform X1 [Frankliniella occidentalis]|uniref:DnaJ homolog subfamily C member 17 n=1 Tax=Frankliniella occidentalis TaxID=133901 RepID=A0A6J1T3S2_FRAOC|nr:dnaJ homolog subfamily C member 17 isoform X1 [Frankliniella occidentalis]